MKHFVDTSAWCALIDKADAKYPEAKNFWEQIQQKDGTLVTTDYVLDETLTLLRFKLNHSSAVAFGRSVLSSQVCELVKIENKLIEKAWDIFVKYNDKKFSFTDCSSFALMREFGMKTAFSFDKHFKQFGFTILPN